jgi:hypothetical protein
MFMAISTCALPGAGTRGNWNFFDGELDMQNRESYACATATRLTIAMLLAEKSHLEELSHQQIYEHFHGTVSLRTIERHVAWVRREYARDKLADFFERVRRARQGYPSPFDELSAA